MKNNKFKNIIFDWSGVIKDWSCGFDWVVNHILKDMGHKEMAPGEIRRNWEQPYMKFWNRYIPEMTLEQQNKLYHKAISSEECPEAGDYPGITVLIKNLKAQGLHMSVVSSDPNEELLREIKEFGLEGIFDDVITDAHDKSEGVDELIKKYSFEKDKTVFIGDSNHEVEVGKWAGIKTIAVTWGFCSEEKLKSTNPDYLVHNIKELEEILL